MNKKLKILYVSPNGYLGGAERFVLTSASAHNKEKCEASILFYSNGEAVAEAKSAGIPVKILTTKL